MTITKLIYWIVGVSAALFLLGAVWFIFFVPPAATPPAQTPTNGTAPGTQSVGNTSTSVEVEGGGTTAAGKMTEVAAQAGGGVGVKDFINDGITAADVVNPGHYYLAGSVGYCLGDGRCPSGTDTKEFSITYDKDGEFFNITLFAEPFGEVRKKAEELLLSRLGITELEACTLRYNVGMPSWVSQYYTGTNLGFSFCPGATLLP